MHNITIAVARTHGDAVESLLETIRYSKEVFGKNVYFQLVSTDWDHPYNPLPADLLHYLDSVVGEDNYALVASNTAPIGLEVYGNPEHLGLRIQTEVTF